MEHLLTPALIFLGLGLFTSALLAIASKIFEVKKNERAEAIKDCLPGANCGGCGYAGCSALAEAIERGDAKVGACTVGGAEVASKVAEIMGVEVGDTVRMRAQVMCSGTAEFARKKYVYEGVNDCVAAARIGGGDKLCEHGCIGLGTCAAACPFGAIDVVEGVAAVDYTKCKGCSVCVSACPKGLIELIPFDSKHWVGCSCEENGKTTRSLCDVGCIACKICEKNCPSEAITIENNLAKIQYDKCTGCDICIDKCPRHIIWSGEVQGKLGLVIRRAGKTV